MSDAALRRAGAPYLPSDGSRQRDSHDDDPYKLGRNLEVDAPGHGAGGPADQHIVVGYGFWIFLLSDIVMFSAFFAAYAVLRDATAGGPAARDLFELPGVAVETAVLLASSFFCGMANIALIERNQRWFQLAMVVTGLCGATFLLLEAREFQHLVSIGAGPSRSAFLSAFFTLVGCHGLHVSIGMLWLGTMMAQVAAKGFSPMMDRRFLCFSLFWHALDIVWVAVFTIVYLLGVA